MKTTPKSKSIIEGKRFRRDRNANFSIEEEDLLCELVLKWREVLLDKATDAFSVESKKQVWENIGLELNASTVSKAFRSTKNLIGKFKNLKTRLRQGYYKDVILSRPKRELFAAILATMEDVQSNCGKKEIGHETVSIPEAPSNPIETPEDSKVTQCTSRIKTRLRKDSYKGDRYSPSGQEHFAASSPSDDDNLSICGEIEHPMVSIPEASPNRHETHKTSNATQRILPSINSASIAKRIYYENEEKRATERHEMQMKMWKAERREKREVHEMLIEEYRLRGELLSAQIANEKYKKRLRMSSEEIF